MCILNSIFAISSGAYGQVQQEEQAAQQGIDNAQSKANSSNYSDEDVIDAKYTKECM